jgi:hypothetical protein
MEAAPKVLGYCMKFNPLVWAELPCRVSAGGLDDRRLTLNCGIFTIGELL